MDRLYGPLSALDRAADHLITLGLLNSLYGLMLLLAVVMATRWLSRLSRQAAALLVDRSGWPGVEDCRFNPLADGRVEAVTPEAGLQSFRSVDLLARFLEKRCKARGAPFDRTAFGALIEARRPDSITRP
jgi:hypothetical protein